MKLISLGNFDKKVFIYLLLYIIIEVPYLSLKTYLTNEKGGISNLPLYNLIYIFGFNFFGIYEYIMRKKSSKKKLEHKETEKKDNKIIYLYRSPKSPINCKDLSILIIFIIIIYIFRFLLDIFSNIFLKKLKFVTDEFFDVLDIVFLVVIFRIIHKKIFYRHH